jgi:lipoprotein
MRKSNFGNIEKVNTVAITFASCKLVKEEWEEREPSDVGFDFWDDWDLVTGLYIPITENDIRAKFEEILADGDKEFQQRKDVADETYLKMDFYLNIHENPKYYGISAKFIKGQKPIVDYNDRGLMDPNVDQKVLDKIAKYMVANNLTTEE